MNVLAQKANRLMIYVVKVPFLLCFLLWIVEPIFLRGNTITGPQKFVRQISFAPVAKAPSSGNDVDVACPMPTVNKDVLFKEKCNFVVDGPSCGYNKKAVEVLSKFETNKNNALLIFTLQIILFGALGQSLLKYLERRLAKSNDPFTSEVLQTAFKQVAIVAVPTILLWSCMKTPYARTLDTYLFQEFTRHEGDPASQLGLKECLLEEIFEKVFSVGIVMMIGYLIFVLFFRILIKRISFWLQKTDNLSVLSVAHEAHENRSCCKFEKMHQACYFAMRHDFVQNVNSLGIFTNDPAGYYFLEYLQSSLIRMSINMIRFPTSTLIFVAILVSCFRPIFHLRGIHQVIAICSISTAFSLGALLSLIYAKMIYNRLLPSRVPEYLLAKYHIGENEKNTFDDLAPSLTPKYKLQKQQSARANWISTLLYGTTHPNRHEQLFFFWARGPNLLWRFFESMCFCQLIVLAYWTLVIREHNQVWVANCWGYVIFITSVLSHVFIIGTTVYYLLFVLHGGMLLDSDLLANVWETQSSENISKAAEFIDALEIRSNLYEIHEGGEMYWRQLVVKTRTSSKQVQDQMLFFWARLDESQSGIIRMNKVMSFLTSQGLNVRTEENLSYFMEVFDRDHKGGLNQEEFFVLVLVVKQILSDPLDEQAVQTLIQSCFGIPMGSQSTIDLELFSKIVTQLGINWSEGRKRFIMNTLCGDGAVTSIPAKVFLAHLVALEEKLVQAVEFRLPNRA